MTPSAASEITGALDYLTTAANRCASRAEAILEQFVEPPAPQEAPSTLAAPEPYMPPYFHGLRARIREIEHSLSRIESVLDRVPE